VRECKGRNYLKCGGRHNTKLHDNNRNTTSEPPNAPIDIHEPATVAHVNLHDMEPDVYEPLKQIMLATSVILLKDFNGQFIPCRAVLDSGSQVCLITKTYAMKLNLNIIHNTLSISGVNSTSAKTTTGIPGNWKFSSILKSVYT